jgi:hypothetical protein
MSTLSGSRTVHSDPFRIANRPWRPGQGRHGIPSVRIMRKSGWRAEARRYDRIAGLFDVKPRAKEQACRWSKRQKTR